MTILLLLKLIVTVSESEICLAHTVFLRSEGIPFTGLSILSEGIPFADLSIISELSEHPIRAKQLINTAVIIPNTKPVFFINASKKDSLIYHNSSN
jgi:hypothetical protein